MLRNYFKIALRNMGRNKLFTGLNIIGLATGLACSILIFLWIQDELAYDNFNFDADRIFRLTAQVRDLQSATVPYAFAAAMKKELPEIRNSSFLHPEQKIVTAADRKFDEKQILYADSGFLAIFNYPLMYGNISTVLSGPDRAVVTEETAIKYFGSAARAVGQTLFIDADSQTFRISGVLKNIPHQSHLQFDLLLSGENWWQHIDPSQAWKYFDSYTYFELADHLEPDPARIREIEKKLNAMRNRAIAGSSAVPAIISIQPLKDIHLRSHFSNDVPGQGNISYVRIFSLVDLFVILIACINFMNLATAVSGKRAKEVGLRKTVGASRGQLIAQFIGESMLMAFIAMLLALLLVWLALPLFNAITSKSFTLSLLSLDFAGKMIIISLLTGLLAGCYPAFYLSSFNAIISLAGNRGNGKTGLILRDGLVVFQFVVAIVLIISTVIINKQLSFIRQRDIGYNRENLLYVSLPDIGDRDAHNDALSSTMTQSLYADDFTIVSQLPTNLDGTRPLTWRGMEKGELVLAQHLNVDVRFAKTFGMKLPAGRFFSADFPGDDSGYVINETAARAMHFTAQTVLGKYISIRSKEGPVIGVLKDFNFKPVSKSIEPLVIRTALPGDFLVLRYPPAGLPQTMKRAKEYFQQIYGDAPFHFGFIDQDLDRLYLRRPRPSFHLHLGCCCLL